MWTNLHAFILLVRAYFLSKVKSFVKKKTVLGQTEFTLILWNTVLKHGFRSLYNVCKKSINDPGSTMGWVRWTKKQEWVRLSIPIVRTLRCVMVARWWESVDINRPQQLLNAEALIPPLTWSKTTWSNSYSSNSTTITQEFMDWGLGWGLRV